MTETGKGGRSEYKNKRPDPDEDYGYYFYPERGGDAKEKSVLKSLLPGGSSRNSFKCMTNVFNCIKKDPMVKTLVGALTSHGCPVTMSRHFSCEDCMSRVNGGFDPKNHQVVVCQNNSTSAAVTCSVIAHELLHMFDYCRAHVDFDKLEHLACTEIRAASHMHCSFLSAWVDGDASPINYKDRHRECVKRKAMMSVLMVRNISIPEAEAVVDQVFKKCYNDHEPFGRIPRRKSRDPFRILGESYLYGYTDSGT